MAITLDASREPTKAAAAGGAPQKALDKEAFLKILVAQISQQDPLKPMEGTEFVTQLSQFAVVEQAIAQSARLETLSTQVGGLANSEMVGLVGKTVELRGERVAFDGEKAVDVTRSLAAPAKQVTVRVQDASGRTVRTMELGSRPQGVLSIHWDGKDDAGRPLGAGAYSVQAHATSESGASVAASSASRGRVVRVTFDKGYPEIHLDTGGSAPVSDLVEVAEK